MKGEKVAAKLFFKIVEAYILIEYYKLDKDCIFKRKINIYTKFIESAYTICFFIFGKII